MTPIAARKKPNLYSTLRQALSPSSTTGKTKKTKAKYRIRAMPIPTASSCLIVMPQLWRTELKKCQRPANAAITLDLKANTASASKSADNPSKRNAGGKTIQTRGRLASAIQARHRGALLPSQKASSAGWGRWGDALRRRRCHALAVTCARSEGGAAPVSRACRDVSAQ